MDSEDSVYKGESQTAVFPLLSNEQTTLKPGADHRALRVAWEDTKLKATVSDKTAAEKVRFRNEETTCEGQWLECLRFSVIVELRRCSLSLLLFPCSRLQDVTNAILLNLIMMMSMNIID